MRELFHAGITAAKVQAVLVVGISIAVVMSVDPARFTLTTGDAVPGASASPVSVRLAWVDILAAMCVAMVRGRHIELTASRLLTGFRRISPRNSGRLATALLAQLSFAALGFVILALKETPVLILELGHELGFPGYVTILWPAICSIGIAAFGANAHAAALARSRLPT
jgi:hypothetical protein